MVRSRSLVLLVAIAACLFVVSSSSAQPAPGAFGKPAVRSNNTAPVATTPPPPPPPTAGVVGPTAGFALSPQEAPKPPGNLGIVALRNNQCDVEVMLRNQGAALPATFQDVTLYVKPAGREREIALTVSADRLRAAGSDVVVKVPGIKLEPSAVQEITARITTNVRDHRTGAAGTTMTNKLRCVQSPVALDLDVGFDADCRTRVVVRNTGSDLRLPDGLLLTRALEGWSYSTAIPVSGEIASGRSVEKIDARAYDEVEYAVRSTAGGPNGQPFAQAKASAPARCRAGKPNYAINLANVFVDRSCRAVVSVANTGEQLPDGIVLSVSVTRKGERQGFMKLAIGGMKPGDRRDLVWDSVKLDATPVDVRVALYPPSGVIEKSMPLSCNGR